MIPISNEFTVPADIDRVIRRVRDRRGHIRRVAEIRDREILAELPHGDAGPDRAAGLAWDRFQVLVEKREDRHFPSPILE